ncbi:MAG: hypothetical protein RLP44_32075 [Aggregatilineales bacterium]
MSSDILDYPMSSTDIYRSKAKKIIPFDASTLESTKTHSHSIDVLLSSTAEVTLSDIASRLQQIIEKHGLRTLYDSSSDVASLILPNQASNQGLHSEVLNLFRSAVGTRFEDGMDSAFSLRLQAMIMTYGNETVKIIDNVIFNEQVDADVVSESLRWIGKVEGHQTHRLRRLLLETSLHHPSPMARDGAILGLSFMDDPESITALEYAIKNEKLNSLKADMQQVLEQLYETREMLS